MLRIKTTSQFKKGLKRAKKRGLNLDLIMDVIENLKNGNTLDKKYNDHALKGKYKDFRECHIQPDWLLVYFIENDILTLTLVDTSTHADIFDI